MRRGYTRPAVMDRFQGYGGGHSLRKAVNMRERMNEEADLLDAMGKDGSALRAVAASLSLASLERIHG